MEFVPSTLSSERCSLPTDKHTAQSRTTNPIFLAKLFDCEWPQAEWPQAWWHSGLRPLAVEALWILRVPHVFLGSMVCLFPTLYPEGLLRVSTEKIANIL